MFPRNTQRLADAIFWLGGLAAVGLFGYGIYSLWQLVQ